MASGPITSWQIDGGKLETVTDFLFLGSKITADGDCSHEIKRHLLCGRKTMTNLDRDTTFLTKVCLVKAMVFPVVNVWIWELDHKEGWVLQNWWFQIVVLGKTLENSLDCKEMKPINSKGYHLWIFIGRTDAEVEAPIIWRRVDSLEKTLGKTEGKRRRGRQDEMVGWHHWLLSLSKLWERVKDREVWSAVVHEVTKNGTQLSNWTRTNYEKPAWKKKPLHKKSEE